VQVLEEKYYMENINQGIGEMGAVNHRPHQQQGLAHKSLPETTSSLRQSDSAGISPRSRLHHHKYFINQKAVPEDGRELGSFVKILYRAGKKGEVRLGGRKHGLSGVPCLFKQTESR
jgi:hypothetical protein